MLKNNEDQPEEVIVLHKQTFLQCMAALGIFIGNSFDYLAQVKKSDMDPDVKAMLVAIVKNDIDIVSNISEGLKHSMDYKIEADITKEYIN